VQQNNAADRQQLPSTKQKSAHLAKSREEMSVTGRTAKRTLQTSANRNLTKLTSIKGPAAKQGDKSQSQPQQAAKNLLMMYQPVGAKKLWTAEDVLTPFKEIFTSNISSFFRKMEKNIVPLSLVGHLLNYVGNHLLHYAFKSAGKRIYMPLHKALSVHLMGNGEIMTQVLKTEFSILPDPSANPPSFRVIEGE